MLIIYRMCDITPTNPAPWGADKREVNLRCLRSFVKAYKDINPTIHFICDYCPKDVYTKMIEDNCPLHHTTQFTELGINATMLLSYELASRKGNEVLFQECDYLYRPGIGKTMLKAIQELGLVSPYDHLNFYLDKSIHSDTCDIKLVDNHHFRTTERNTMTWGTHTDMIRQNRGALDKEGYLDDKIWFELLVSGYQLHVPILSFATHMVKDYLAPGVDWKELWNQYQS